MILKLKASSVDFRLCRLDAAAFAISIGSLSCRSGKLLKHIAVRSEWESAVSGGYKISTSGPTSTLKLHTTLGSEVSPCIHIFVQGKSHKQIAHCRKAVQSMLGGPVSLSSPICTDWRRGWRTLLTFSILSSICDIAHLCCSCTRASYHTVDVNGLGCNLIRLRPQGRPS